jgi:hypothetical protein
VRDPLYLILKMLNTILSRIIGIFSLIFLNYFPGTSPQEKPDRDFFD